MHALDIKDITEALISHKHGWSVAQQFADTYTGDEQFETQNYNAMELVSSTVRDLVRSEILADGYELEELKRYHERLEAYLSEA